MLTQSSDPTRDGPSEWCNPIRPDPQDQEIERKDGDPDSHPLGATPGANAIMNGKSVQPENDAIAEMLDRVADLLEAQHASVYRIRAYRAGARTVRTQVDSISESIAAGEPDPLEDLPSIGKSIAAVIREFVASGRPRLLERLEGQTSPADLFATIPGIGEGLAERIETQLHLDTLEDLEAAAHDGRLAEVPGFGPRRIRGVQESLAHLLRYSSARRSTALASDRPSESPSVSALLVVDGRYAVASERGQLRMITPRRFNPENRAWLPVLHCEVEGWSMTALFSNTARAHQLGRTDDWVVIYFDRDGMAGQCTVVTEHSGVLKGRRVVRGREQECAQHYRAASPRDPPVGRSDSA